ncbi:MAG: alpha/beta hydrolase, partial [Xanthomonadales bacterium]
MRTLVVFLAFAAVLYVGLAVVLYLLQERMVFLPHLPGRALDATPEAIGLEYTDADIETADGERLHGWFVPADHARGTLLFFHGNAGNIAHRLDSLALFNRLGLDVLMVDYRGYGQSSGAPSEAGTYSDAQAAWDWLLARGTLLFFHGNAGNIAHRL